MNATLSPADWQALAEEETHPLRLILLNHFRQHPDEPISPLMASREWLAYDLGTCSYHFRVLVKRGWIEAHSEIPRRGSTEHFYVLAEGRRG